MIVKALGALALALTPCAVLSQDSAPNGGMPPAEYRGESYSIVIFTNDVSRYCGKSPFPGMVIVACTFTDKGIVVMPNPCPLGDVEQYAKIMCHENGHRQGWKH